MLPRRILSIIVSSFFLVLQQQENINLMLCCLLFMQNLRAQNLLLTRFIRRQRNCYRRRAPCYWTLPRPVESWFAIHYTDRTAFKTLLHIICQIISETKHPRFCFPRFVSVWPAPEVVHGIFEVCPSSTKFCPLVNKLVALLALGNCRIPHHIEPVTVKGWLRGTRKN